jgi:predicted pyridoxine 5'-phosphate oxidase superfamily flavin-nucleotide-binding protein
MARREQVFHGGERVAQERWGSAATWDEARIARLLWDGIPDEHRARVEAFPFLFLATADAEGRCDCSFKGGGPGLLRVLARDRVAFPDFDGNGAFMSLGNLLVNPHAGLLLIDFEDGARLRLEGRATVHDRGPLLELFPGAPRVVELRLSRAVPNCKRFVPRLRPVADGTPDAAPKEAAP